MAALTLFPKAFRQSLSQQLLTGFSACILGIGLTTLLINYYLIKLDLEKQVHARAQTTTQSLEFAIEGLLEMDATPVLERVVQNYATLPTVLEVAVVDPSGKILAQGPASIKADLNYKALRPHLKPSVEEASLSGMGIFVEKTLEGKVQLTHILPFSSRLFSQSGRRGLAIVTVDLHQIRQEIWPTFLTSTTTMVIGAGCMIIIMGTLLKKFVLSPLQRLNATVAESQLNTSFDIPLDLPDNEIRFLAKTFDQVFQERQRAEMELRTSEAQERENAHRLTMTLAELQTTQAQLIQSERMAGLGQMVAGIAHELNNPVNFIQGNLEPVQEYIRDLLNIIGLYQQYFPHPPRQLATELEEADLDFIQHDLPKIIGSMRTGSDRIRNIVLSLRNFSRLDEADCKVVNIHEGIESALVVLQHRFRRSVSSQTEQQETQLIKDYGNLPPIECYPGQMNQVFMHILDNALDALHDSDRTIPTLRIHTQYEGDRCLIKIADNGSGIPKHHLSQIFNPFFTTKPVGEGTGLGLAVSYQTVKHHHGRLTCTSTPGQGTEFVIDIPIRQPGAAQRCNLPHS